MKAARYVYVQLSNQGRQIKKKSNKRYKKSVHELYLKTRTKMSWRLKQFAQKQGYQHMDSYKKNPSHQIHPYVISDYYQYQAQLVKYWGGWKCFKKMGRMDKVRYKQQARQKQYLKQKSKSKDVLSRCKIFHEVDIMLNKKYIEEAFNAIKRCKKPFRNILYTEQ